MKNNTKTAYIAQAAVIAAMYAAFTLCLQPLSFSGWQLRISEALTLLPVLTPAAVPGLAVGCFLANIASPLGAVDMVLGTAATLIAAILTRVTGRIRIKNLPVLSAAFPVIFNAVAVGASISITNSEGFTAGAFVLNALSVAAGESVSCFLLGLPLARVLEKRNIFDRWDKK